MNIRQKNFIPVFSIIVMLCIMASIVTFRQVNSLNMDSVERLIRSTVETFHANVDYAAGQALEKALLFAGNPDVIRALELAGSGNMDNETDPVVQQAREMLRTTMKPYTERFNDFGLPGAVKIHFHLPNGRSFLRLWREKQILRDGEWVDVSDDISAFRKTVLDVSRTGKTVSGVEVGRGGLVIRGVVPVMAPVRRGGGDHVPMPALSPDIPSAVSSDTPSAVSSDTPSGFSSDVPSGFSSDTPSGTSSDIPSGGSPGVSVSSGALATAPSGGYSNVIIGSLEFLLDFEDVVNRLFPSDNYALALFMNRTLLPIAHRFQDESTYKAAGENYIQVMSHQGRGVDITDFTIADADTSLIDQGCRELEISYNRGIVEAAFPVLDYSGRQIAVMALAMDMEEEHRSSRTIIIFQVVLLVMILCVAGIVSSWVLTKTVLRPVDEMIRFADHLATGGIELNSFIPIDSRDEMGRLAKAFNNMMIHVRSMIQNLVDVVNQLTSNTTDISETLEHEAANISEQSASVTEITSTMAEFSASSQQIAKHCDTVLAIAEEALNNAKKGADSVGLINSKMEEINEDNQRTVAGIHELGSKTREVTKILEIINTIADQTKLIAFNAALEASSAGDAGRRFGVVAAEIRRLAESVESSTRETEKKITEIQDAVQRMILASEKSTNCITEGKAFSGHTRETLDAIVTTSQKTRDAARQITLSTQQQQSAGEQVLQALKEIDEGGWQTSGAIKKISETGAALNSLTEQLKKHIKNFKL
ncbi:MAG: HAMP domain-containing protein [Desulfamplus sp.]|nr:HAMP domain-containing protein [Desulfamplus sp.]